MIVLFRLKIVKPLPPKKNIFITVLGWCKGQGEGESQNHFQFWFWTGFSYFWFLIFAGKTVELSDTEVQLQFSGLTVEDNYVLWYKRRTHTQTQTLPLLLFSMMFHPATTFLELRGETWNSHHFSIQTTGYRENNQSVDWIWKSLQKYFQTKLNMGFHWNKNDMLIFTGGTGATHGPDHGQIG